MSLTNTEIRNVKPGSKAIQLFNESRQYLEVSPAGGKWWRLPDHRESRFYATLFIGQPDAGSDVHRISKSLGCAICLFKNGEIEGH